MDELERWAAFFTIARKDQERQAAHEKTKAAARGR
jgi:hypothetical protein